MIRNYRSLRKMHVRGDQNPNHIARRPLTESQEIGWWMKDVPLKKNEPWTQEKRHVHGQSEMTKYERFLSIGFFFLLSLNLFRFVNDMISTDRSFRLF